MKKIIFIGRSECGKTTLIQALRGQPIRYRKTQYIHNLDVVIDTPGEYAENGRLGKALALYAYEADVVGLLLSATEPYSLYPPCITGMVNREVIGIVTKIDAPGADPDRAERWLRLSGCETVYRVSAVRGDGLWQIFAHLREPGDALPFDAGAEAPKKPPKTATRAPARPSESKTPVKSANPKNPAKPASAGGGRKNSKQKINKKEL